MRRILSGFAMVAMLLPIGASAATAEELAAQIQALLDQVNSLQKQVGSATQGGGTGGTNAAQNARPSSLRCPLISRTLKRGSSGIDVTRLQQFLALDPSIYPEGSVTGYYGGLTEAAIKRFQCKNKIVCDGTPSSTGYGVTGPRTAALLALQCNQVAGGGGIDDIASGFIRVTPISGPAPLSVQVEAILNTTQSCRSFNYEIHYGDNAAPINITVPQGYCKELRQVYTHVYRFGGTFSITLRSGVHQNSATVIVAGDPAPTSDSFTASPMSGSAPLNVTFKGVINSAGTCNSGPFRLRFGDGQSQNLTDAGCAPTTINVTHAYTNAGNYIAKLERGSNYDAVSTIAIAVGGSANSGGNFTVTPGVDGDPFKASSTFDLASSCARYDLDWGDSSSHASQSEGSCSAGTTSKSLLHTYSASGSYTLTLKRGANLESTATIALTIVN